MAHTDSDDEAFAYGRDGTPLTMWEAAMLFGDDKYRTVARDSVHGCLVSTVWLPCAHGRDAQGRPVIFETMVFNEDQQASDAGCWRYATEEEALAGHREVLDAVSLRLTGTTKHA